MAFSVEIISSAQPRTVATLLGAWLPQPLWRMCLQYLSQVQNKWHLEGFTCTWAFSHASNSCRTSSNAPVGRGSPRAFLSTGL